MSPDSKSVGFATAQFKSLSLVGEGARVVKKYCSLERALPGGPDRVAEAFLARNS